MTLSAANPLAVLGGAIALSLALFLSLDAVTAALVLLAVVATLRPLGFPLRALVSRGWPLFLAAVGIGWFNALFAAAPGGQAVIEIGPVVITDAALLIGAALAVRLVAIAVVGLVAVTAVDPTRLADALIQQLNVSPRFAIGALAAFGLAPLFAREWEVIGLARRARGVEAASVWGAARDFGGKAHSLLVSAIRRGERMATAMDARGFGSRPCRTSARETPMTARDWLLLGGAAAIAIGATAVSLALGTWRFLLG